MKALRRILTAATLALLSLGALPPAAQAMTFQRVDAAPVCKANPCILAAGDIDNDTVADFAAFLKKSHIQAGATVVFDSPGGVLLPSLALGEAIRDAGLYTAVARYDRRQRRFTNGGECVSACAYAFLGGVQRDVADHARLGVHQFSCAPGTEGSLSISDAQALMVLISIYTRRMVGNSALVMLAAGTLPRDTHWLSSRELRAHGVVTN